MKGTADVLRIAALYLLCIAAICMVAIFGGASPLFAAETQICPAGKPVASFSLLVEPPKGGPALPISEINAIAPGDKLKFEPAHVPPNGKGKAKVAILLAPSATDPSAKIIVLDVKPATQAEEWEVPIRAAIVGVVFGPEGLDERKISKMVEKNPELVLKLTDYVEQTSKVEALVQTLSKYEQSAPGSSNLKSALSQFSSQYGVALPALDSSAPSGQQAEQLLHAVVPALSNDPLAQTSMMQKSTGLAASVATLFLGPQVGLAAGGAALLGELHTALFPHAVFRAAFSEPRAPHALELCSSKDSGKPKSHTRIAYLWAAHVPDAAPPSVSLENAAHIPVGWASSLGATCASVAQLRLLTRARDWRLVSPATSISVPVKVTVGSESDSLQLDLTHAKVPAGTYRLAAKWDWTSINVAGTIELRDFADLAQTKISAASRDKLVAGSGEAKIELSGPDFEFLDGVTLVRARDLQEAARLPFILPRGEEAGVQQTASATLDTAHLEPGAYFLRLKQLNGKTQDVPVTVHPPNPTLLNLPVRVNLGQASQTITLKGTSLERIEKIKSKGATWTLASSGSSANSDSEREATIHLSSTEQEGGLVGASVYVHGIGEPMEIPGVLRVAGPRPQIVNMRRSLAEENGVELREKEIPAGRAVSFVIQVQHAGLSPMLHVACEQSGDTRQELDLSPGERKGADELDLQSDGGADEGAQLFLSFVASDVGRSGCRLEATLSEQDTGNSDAYILGQIIRLPHIDNFSVSDDKIGKSLYAGTLTGEDLQAVSMAGWDPKSPVPVSGIPTPVVGHPGQQTLRIAVPWPPPSPHAPLYIWLVGEKEARLTTATYQ